jgi:hypothetical protein
VVVPIYRAELLPDEKIALRSIRKSFSAEKILFVAPRSLDIARVIRDGEYVERFDDSFFSNVSGYNRLLTSKAFYERFSECSHILICQLDCLVFRDELDLWCEKGFDYIAAPWFMEFLERPEAGLWRVGNGGFSLRNVQSHIRVLKQRILKDYIYPTHGSSPWEPTVPEDEVGLYQKLTPWYRRANPFAKWTTIEEELLRYPRNEDLFWSLEAPKFDPTFRVPSAEEALPFAFEMAPRWCFQKNGSRLPFGCHAWARYDRDFWMDSLDNLNISIPKT